MSAPILKYENPHCKIYHHEDVNCIHLKWNGFSNGEDFQEACEFSLELLVECNSSKILADNRYARVVSPANQKYLEEVWFPKAYEKGYRASAVILAEDLLNQVSVKNIVQKMDKGKFQVQYFKTVEEAKDWLKSV